MSFFIVLIYSKLTSVCYLILFFCYKKKKNLLGNFLITCVYTYRKP